MGVKKERIMARRGTRKTAIVAEGAGKPIHWLQNIFCMCARSQYLFRGFIWCYSPGSMKETGLCFFQILFRGKRDIVVRSHSTGWWNTPDADILIGNNVDLYLVFYIVEIIYITPEMQKAWRYWPQVICILNNRICKLSNWPYYAN